MNIGHKELLICDCKSTDHQMIFLYEEEEVADKRIPICYVHVHLNKRPFLERLKYGVKYIFGYQSRYGAFDEFILNPHDSEKINSLGKYLSNSLANLSWKEFVNHVERQCKEHGVELELSDRSYLDLSDQIKCGGYFDSDIPKLACAKGNKNFKELFVHEYCHMTQWLEKLPLWDESIESINLIDRWIEKKEIKNIKNHIRLAKELELDNEKRVVETIRKWKLDIDIEQYTKKANAYVLFYLYLQESRKWSVPGNSPYENKRILEHMSDKFDMNYNSLDPQLMKIFREELN